MKELSRTELRRLIAEVYKKRYSHDRRDGVECMYTGTYDADLSVFSCCKCGYTQIFEPDIDANQANEALEAYGVYSMKDYRNQHDDWISRIKYRSKAGYKDRHAFANGVDESLPTAKMLALASAVTGEPCTLKELAND